MRVLRNRVFVLWLCLCLYGGGGYVVAEPVLAQQEEGGAAEENEGSEEQEGGAAEEGEGSEEQEVVCSLEAEEVEPAFLRAREYLRNLPAVRTRFVQYDVKGVVSEGLLRLSPPYRMRLDYDAPSGLRLYVNAKEALHVDMNRKFVRQYPVLALPAVRMLQRIFAGRGAQSLQATRVCILGGGEYEVLRVRFRKKATRGYAELYFRVFPYQFLGWDLHDSGSGTTRIRFRGLEVWEGAKVTTFRFEAPWVAKREER